MANFSAKRVQKELKDFFSSEEARQGAIKMELANDDYSELKCEIAGPADTPYEGGKFELEIKIPINYPYRPPLIRFMTKIWHPNISFATGNICSNILNVDQWSPALTFKCLLLTMQAVLSAAEPDDLQDVVVAKQFKQNPDMFKLTACHWTNIYAGGPTKYQVFDDKIQQLVEMGLDEMKCRVVLSSCDWDMISALQELLNISTPTLED